MSYLGAIGIGQESAYGQQAAITDWVQAVSESLTMSQPEDVSSAIFGSSQIVDTIPGRITAGGGMQVPFYGGTAMARLLKFANRNTTSAGFSVAAFNVTASPEAGGSLAVGTYSVAVAAVLQHAATGALYAMTAVPAQTAHCSGSDLSINVTWSNPSAGDVPYGFTLAGSLLYRSAADGNTMHAARYAHGSLTTALLDGSEVLGSLAPTEALYKHAFKPNHAQPPSFTIEAINNNGTSRVFTGAVVNQLQISVKPGERVMASLDLKCQTMISTSPSTPAIQALNGFHGKDSVVFIADQNGDYTQQNLCNAFELTLTNNVEARPALNGHAYDRAQRAKRREVKGSFDFDFESHEQQDAMLAKQPKDVSLYVFGPASKPGAFLSDSGYIRAFPYLLRIHIPNFQYESTTSNLNADSPIVDKLPFIARYDATAAYECAFELINTTASL